MIPMQVRSIAIAALCAALLALSLPVAAQTPPAEKPPTEEPKKQDPVPAPPNPEPAPATPKAPEKSDAAAPDAAIAAIRDFIAKESAGDSPRIDKKKDGWRTRLPKFPTIAFTAGKTYSWNLETNKGRMKVRFHPDIAPNHVTNFIYLSELGYFDGLIFHRVIRGFMAQGGCPLGSGRGNPGYSFPGEFPKENGVLKAKHDKPGILSTANAGPGTDGSQFFLTFVPRPQLDGGYTVFGEVVEGMETLRAIEACGAERDPGTPTERLTIQKATITVE